MHSILHIREPDSMKLSKNQSEAVSIDSGPALILAGPGSGKTTVLTARIQYLIEKCNVNPSSILVITFTRDAANEMKRRFLARCGADRTTVSFGTFHSIFFGILKNAYNLNSSQIITPGFRYAFIRELISGFHITPSGNEEDFIENLLSEISAVKNNRIGIDTYYSKNCGAEEFRVLYKEYVKKLKNNRLIDFDDMLLMTYELFSSRDDYLGAWQNKYKYILVDEAQDMNSLQYDVTKMLALPEKNLFIVGDDDQSIYGFRGAMPGILRQFTEDFVDCKRVLLDENYRCDGVIVEYSSKLISHNENRFEKQLHSIFKGNGRVFISEYESISDENKAIIDTMLDYRSAGIAFSDMAVLYRTNRQSTLLMEMLMRAGIPFVSKEKVPIIYDSAIARDILAYLRMCYGKISRSDMLLVMNKPLRYLSRDYLDKAEVDLEDWADSYYDKPWMAERVRELADDLEFMATVSPYAAITYLRKHVGYDEYLRQMVREKGFDFDESFGILEEITDAAKGFNTFEQFTAHIEEFRERQKESIDKNNAPADEKNAVRIMTLHGSKGLEFDAVFIPQINENILPYKKAVLPEQLEEERRLLYVGMTRARMYLRLSSDKSMYKKVSKPSYFLDEIKG